MTHLATADRKTQPVRAGIFSTLQGAERAVRGLLAAGFTKEQITVICSDETKERYFREFEHQEPAGANTQAAAAAGGAIGATIGGVAAGAVGVATGGLPLLVAGGIGLMAGAIWGGFIGAMMTRGIEKEAANFYDQEVQRGKLLVTVEEKGDHHIPTLADAERIFAEAGAEPIPLSEG
jgi:outer membrane lipoprotein SlyB